MSQSLAALDVHIVFSTKFRVPVLAERFRPDLFRYMSAICKNYRSIPHEIGGLSDHVHVFCSLPRDLAICQLVEQIKVGSSKWMKRQDTSLQGFSWQAGYGAFSVSRSNFARVKNYVVNQEMHHRANSFATEMQNLCIKYQVRFDERYLLD
jgi:REP element-mobilizing transposase RayT